MNETDLWLYGLLNEKLLQYKTMIYLEPHLKSKIQAIPLALLKLPSEPQPCPPECILIFIQ